VHGNNAHAFKDTYNIGIVSQFQAVISNIC
jgi:hypothetical protein